MVAVLFAPGEDGHVASNYHQDGISTARENPLVNATKLSTEMLFTRYRVLESGTILECWCAAETTANGPSWYNIHHRRV
jgi:hypothetical protein